MSAQLIIIGIIVIFLVFAFSQSKPQPPAKLPVQSANQQINLASSTTTSSSAKGVIIVKTPAKGEEIKSPLTVTGFVYGNNGIITIKLKQKESGQYVTEDKVVKIEGKSDQISFAEAIQFGLPIIPQTGILEVEYKDASGKSLDDKVSLEVNFPSDLGPGK